MSQYKLGNVTVTNGGTSVIGASCDWLTASNVRVGDLFKVRALAAWYTVSAVNTATKVTISPAYAGSNASNVAYTIARDFTSNANIPEMSGGDVDWPDVYTRAMRAIDTKMYNIQVASPAGAHTVVASQQFVTATGGITITLPRATEKMRIYIANRAGGTLTIAASSPPDYIASTDGGNEGTITRVGKYSTVTLVSDGSTKYYIF